LCCLRVPVRIISSRSSRSNVSCRNTMLTSATPGQPQSLQFASIGWPAPSTLESAGMCSCSKHVATC
jgi:hypothetical protein